MKSRRNGRRLHGRRGLKSFLQETLSCLKRRRLHGRRGLKCDRYARTLGQRTSPPSRAAWIEMNAARIRLTRGASPPSRAAWIEIFYSIFKPIDALVAAFTGGVD